MLPERFVGTDVDRLLAAARSRFGDEALIVSLDRRPGGAAGEYELVAAASKPPTPGAEAPRPAAPRPGRAAEGPRPTGEPGPRVIALIGPTGAGKTTTIAKLAGHAGAFGERRVALLGLDTFRVGGLEQLRLYADLCGATFDAAYDPGEAARARHRLRRCDIVLVDTAGRGPGRGDDALATVAMLESLRPDEVHLVVPAGLAASRARALVEAAAAWGTTHLLPTKLDEHPHERHVFELARERDWPIAWWTDGQAVPGDLHALAAGADPATVRLRLESAARLREVLVP